MLPAIEDEEKRSMSFSRLRTSMLLAAGLLSAVPPPSSHAEMPFLWRTNSKIVIPFRNVDDEIVVTLSLDGHKGLNFLIDTGSGFSILDAKEAAAADVKILPLNAPPSQSVGGAFTPNQAAPHARITGYGLELRDNFVVGDLDNLKKGLGIPLAGIIGFDFLGQFPLLVDYSAQTITILSPKSKNDTPLQSIQVPIEPPIPGEANGPIVRLDLELPGGRRVNANLVVDTGSAEGLILHAPFVEKYRLKPVAQAKTVSRTSYSGTYNATPAVVPALLLGNLKLEHVQALYPQNPAGAAGNERIDGEIGYEILTRFRIFINAPQHIIVFEPATQN